MKLLMPVFFPLLVCLALVVSLAIFLAGTFVFLATQAFYEIHATNGSLLAYLIVVAGIMVFCIIAFRLIQEGLYCFVKKHAEELKTGLAQRLGFTPFNKVALGVLVYEMAKLYLNKNKT